jgi:hypothetical protein
MLGRDIGKTTTPTSNMKKVNLKLKDGLESIHALFFSLGQRAKILF